jgi:HD-like signal output (HDOD) protein
MGANPLPHELNTDTERKEQASVTSSDEKSGVDKFIASLMDDLRHNRLELPTLPQVAVKISRVVENPGSRAKDVAQAIGTDMALSARILQIANSPLIRSDKNIDNVQMAVTRMGNNMVKNVITSYLVKQLFRTSQVSLQKRMAAIWNHSAHVAAISHVLTTRYTDFQTDEVMLAGLIHDIGKLPILAKARTVPGLRSDEKTLDAVLAKLHPALGKAILTAWKFPEEIICAAAEHENMQRDSAKLDITDIVIVANLHSFIGKSDAKKVDWNQIPAMQKLGLDADMSIGVLEEAREEIMEIQKVLAQ